MKLRHLLKIILFLVFFNIAFSHVIFSQHWMKLTPQYSSGDSIVDIDDGLFITKDVGWIISSHYDSAIHSQIFKTTDGGNNWDLKKYTEDIYLLHCYATDSLHFWAYNARGQILMTNDGGEKWYKSYVGDSLLVTASEKIYFFDNMEGFAIGDYKWSTTDGGVNWTILDTNQLRTIRKTDLCFATRQRGWIVSNYNLLMLDGGAIVMTSDGGESWSFQGEQIGSTLCAPGPLHGLFCVDTNTVFAVGTNGFWSASYVYRTANGGLAWDAQWKTDVYYFNDIGFLYPSRGYIVGAGGKIYKTTDGGDTWSLNAIVTDSDLKKIYVFPGVDNDVIYIFGDAGTIIRGDNATAVNGRNDTITKDFLLSANYPNPFNPSTQISYSVTKATDVTLKIYDVLGREIAVLVNERKQPGEYNVIWTAEGVPSGVYFYRILAGEFTQTKKMVVTR